MKNNQKLKLTYTFLIIIFLILSLYFTYQTYLKYNTNYNITINNIITTIKEKYPNITEEEIIKILNNENITLKDNLKSYSIDIKKEASIKSNTKILSISLLTISLIIITLSITIITINYINNKKQLKKLKEIERDIRKINKGNYELDMSTYKENDFSILKSEIYKTMVSLKEATINLDNDKLKLKTSLEDISHQLKTPLTSIMLSLDNLGYDKITKEEYKRFLEIIKHNTENMNFLIHSLLKLSMFDTNTVIFNNEENSLIDIIKSSIKDTENLIDLKNITLITNFPNEDLSLLCDKHWQKEAITNILKNAVEHAKEKVYITIHKNKMFYEIDISNDGDKIASEDLPNIFKRFYKGKNNTKESVGIGLSLAKEIVSKNDGTIEVTTTDNLTTFKIKYWFFNY